PLQAGDAGAGANTFMAKGCVGCHGAAGKAPIAATYPAIGGKPADFIAVELNKFRTGERNNPIMMPMAASLNDADVANLAAYLAAQ
ncbi:MAG: c-type cytochrome, partial [Gammaproteobacteria bacterium]|nr:c-type cytochrome [Gammaproteobacteria bacterium]